MKAVEKVLSFFGGLFLVIGVLELLGTLVMFFMGVNYALAAFLAAGAFLLIGWGLIRAATSIKRKENSSAHEKSSQSALSSKTQGNQTAQKSKSAQKQHAPYTAKSASANTLSSGGEKQGDLAQQIPLTGVMKSFAKKLKQEGIVYTAESIEQDNLSHLALELLSSTCISLETTQLFTNPKCAMTYLQKDWRANTFSTGGLGNIDFMISESWNLCFSATVPGQNLAKIANAEKQLALREQLKQQITVLIGQSQGLFAQLGGGALCGDNLLGNPYLKLSFELFNPVGQNTDQLFSLLQLFALEVHRIFGQLDLAKS